MILWRSGHFTQFMAAVVDLQARARIQALEERAARRDRDVAVLFACVAQLTAPMARGGRASVPSDSHPPVQAPQRAAPAVAAPSAAFLSSVIVADFPALFAEFRGKRFTLLWRGSRDGFRARLSRPLRRPRAHSDTDPGHKGEHFRGLHACEVGVA
jgi:hypothetical protein